MSTHTIEAPTKPDLKTERTRTTYTHEQQAIVDGLLECQRHLGREGVPLSNKEFCDQWIKTYSEATYSKVTRGFYEAKDVKKTFAELSEALISIRRRIARLATLSDGGKFYEFDLFAALFASVRECLTKKGQNRLIFFAAPTGAGKTRFFTELEAREDVTAVNANEAWHGSYFYAARDILGALGVTGKFASAGEARSEMINAMKGRVKVLAIDEGNYFGPRSINLVKDVLNETEWTVVVGLTPADFDKMKRYYTEWSQLQRRIHTVYRWSPLTSAECQRVLADAGLNGDAKESALLLAKAANSFGAMDFVARVIARIDATAGDSRHPTIEDVKAAIQFVQKQLDLVPSK